MLCQQWLKDIKRVLNICAVVSGKCSYREMSMGTINQRVLVKLNMISFLGNV